MARTDLVAPLAAQRPGQGASAAELLAVRDILATATAIRIARGASSVFLGLSIEEVTTATCARCSCLLFRSDFSIERVCDVVHRLRGARQRRT